MVPVRFRETSVGVFEALLTGNGGGGLQEAEDFHGVERAIGLPALRLEVLAIPAAPPGWQTVDIGEGQIVFQDQVRHPHHSSLDALLQRLVGETAHEEPRALTDVALDQDGSRIHAVDGKPESLCQHNNSG